MAEASNTLQTEPVRSLLARLHAEARGDRWKFVALAPRLVAGMIRGKTFSEIVTPEALKDAFIPISPEQGQLLYLTARALGARNVVEFGTSFAISTIYLAAAVRDNGGGRVIGTEIEPSKHSRAEAHLAEAGLSDVAEVRLGDALETLVDVPTPIDLVLIDGWKDLYLPVLKLLTPKLAPRAVVLADNIFTFKKDLRPYVEYVQSGEHGFVSTTLHLSDGFEYSVYVGDASART
ncbi:MAG: class I SAM-dependent methyltransferase [Deltaproteobacteria bacterium]|nr:class I SAM-dependent methyltransferase [Deltaproteobacteria bacterium]